MRARIVWLGLLAIFGLLGASSAGAQTQDPFAAIANQLAAGLTRAAPNEVLRIAVWPFEANKIPIPIDEGDAYTLSLENALATALGSRAKMFTRGNLAPILREVREFGGVGLPDENPIAALRQNDKLDALVIGHIVRSGDELTLQFQVQRLRDGGILSTAEWRKPRAVGGPSAQTLDAALRDASVRLREGAPNLTSLRLAGTTCEDTGIATRRGTFVGERAFTALTDAYHNSITGRTIARLSPDDPPAPGHYVLTGNYWLFGETMELSLQLNGYQGALARWSGRVYRDSMPPLSDPAACGFGPFTDNKIGTIAFALDTRQGTSPVYHFGDKLELRARFNRDAWLYCFYLQGPDHTVVRMFPNEFHPEAKLVGNQSHLIPGSLMNFDLNIQAPEGADLVKCFAATRDVSADLPIEFRDVKNTSWARGADERIAAAFRGVRNASITEATVVVNVVP